MRVLFKDYGDTTKIEANKYELREIARIVKSFNVIVKAIEKAEKESKKGDNK